MLAAVAVVQKTGMEIASCFFSWPAFLLKLPWVQYHADYQQNNGASSQVCWAEAWAEAWSPILAMTILLMKHLFPCYSRAFLGARLGVYMHLSNRDATDLASESL